MELKLMNIRPWIQDRFPQRRNLLITPLLALVASLGLPIAGWGALPTPAVDMGFSEPAGSFDTANVGSLGGRAYFFDGDLSGFPVLSSRVPQGPFAPSNNTGSLDMGAIAADQGNRAADLVTAVGPFGSLGSFNSFTLCGWVNARDLNEGWGGNRIMFALETPDGPGFDLVSLGSGALRIGINQWPDGGGGGGPLSSSGKITADPELGSANWIFFAVAYDPSLESGHLKYYFGRGDTLAALDTTHDYRGGIDNGGIIEYTGELTLGNFGVVVGARSDLGPNGMSRVFRGLIDEVKVFDRALELAEIQEAQLDGAVPAVAAAITQQPQSQTVFEGQRARFTVGATGTAPLLYQWQTWDGANWVDVAGATSVEYVIASTALNQDGTMIRVQVENTLTSDLFSESATLTVVPSSGKIVSISFVQGAATVANAGDLGGSGTLTQTDGFPVLSANVPVGPQAPTENTASMDFGPIADGQGGRAIDFTNPYGGTLGSLDRFTVTAWVNVRDLAIGWGGNRLAFALAAPNGPGFDLVHLADGALQLGVNQWPDGTPAISSPGLLTADAGVGAANWTFVAVTYDGLAETANVGFYAGNANQSAQLDLTRDYPRGPISQSGGLTLGNFGTVVGARNETGTPGSRVLRGLIDELKVFNRVLTLDEIQQAQKASAAVAVEEPRLNVLVPSSGNVEFSWESTGAFQLQERATLGAGDWHDVAISPVVDGNRSTVSVPIEAGARFFRLTSE
jgi:hypothetical protein